MLTSDSITAIMPAFIKAQGNFAPALKSATNPHYRSKYVALDGVIDAVAGALRDQGIAIMQMTDIEDARTVLITRLIHESGEWLGGRYPVYPVKADPQGEGSALTYARRYALMALVGIAPEDDDGNAATKAVQKETSIKPFSTNGGKALPTDGVWDKQNDESKAFLLKLAAEVVTRVASDPLDAYEYIEGQQLDADEKAALWTRLESPIRTALTKAHKTLKEKAA